MIQKGGLNKIHKNDFAILFKNTIFHRDYVALLLVAFLFCQCHSKKTFLPKKAILTPTEQFNNCQGYQLFVGYNSLKECIYEQYSCLNNQRGTYLAYSKCDKKVDTLIWIEYKVNPEYQYKAPSQIKSPTKQHYKYIADGDFFLREGFKKRGLYTHPIHVYINELPQKYPLDLFNEKRYTQWGDLAYWIWGSQKGAFINGLRQKKWIVTEYEEKEVDGIYTYLPKNRLEISYYKDGLKEGETVYLHKRDTSNNPYPSSWSDTLKVIPYENGKINGWVKQWKENGDFLDSVLYQNDVIVK